jgi:dienelactone hydrolase
MRRRYWIAVVTLTGLLLTGIFAVVRMTERSQPVPAALACFAGAYALSDARHAIIYANSHGDGLRVLLPDGSRTDLVPGQRSVAHDGRSLEIASSCLSSAPALVVTRESGRVEARRREFNERMLRIHAGSDDDGEVDRMYWQYALPLAGVGVLMLDKRGSGGSSGKASANFQQRARDVAAAVRFLREEWSQSGNASVRIGLHGASQGGWVAPLAATMVPVDFVIVSYGLAEGVTAEDRDELRAALIKKGHAEPVLTKARALTDLTAAIVRSGWQEGWDALDAWRAINGDESWVADLPHSSYTGVLMRFPRLIAKTLGRWAGPRIDNGVSFDYEPLPVLQSLNVPQLWILGARDQSAPSAQTVSILKALQTSGAPIDVAVFTTADHGMLELLPNGGQTTVIADGYLAMVGQWATSQQLAHIPNGKNWVRHDRPLVRPAVSAPVSVAKS